MRTSNAHLGALFTLATACAESSPPMPSPVTPSLPAVELALIGGVVRTLDPARPHATAVAIRGGRIELVGSDEEVNARIGPNTRVVQLSGRAVVPGLTDGHMHLAGLGATAEKLDLTGTKSVSEIRQKVQHAVESRPPGAWIVGRGWDQNDWVKGGQKAPFPTARDLDSIAPKTPVVLIRVDGHAAWANSAALTLAGLDRKTKDPEGGRIMRGPKGAPTGILVDNAIDLVTRHLPAPTKDSVKKTLLAGQALCLEAGLTQVHDMGQSALEIEVLRELDEAGELSLRVYGMIDGSAPEQEMLLKSGPRLAKQQQRYSLRGVKLFADGALGSRGAALHQPYKDDPKNSGLLLTPPEVLEARVQAAKTAGFQVAVHAIGDRANSLVLDIYEKVYGREGAKHRPRIEHAQVVTLSDIERFGRLAVVASMQPTHATSDMPWAEARLGSKRIEGAYAWQKMRAASATIAAGSDAPVESISVIKGLYAAMYRQDEKGEPAGGWRKEEALTAEQALSAFSAGNAWASFREGEAGVIREGLVADLTVLSADPGAVTPGELLATEVELTIIEGAVAWERAGTDDATQTPGASPQSSL